MRKLVRCSSAMPAGRRLGASSPASARRKRWPQRRPATRASSRSAGLPRVQPRAFRLLEVAADRVGDGFGIAERHEQPGPRSEHVLRVPVRGRDDGAARGERERERAGGDLLPARVRRQEDVGCASRSESSSTDRNRSSNTTWFRDRARRRAARASAGSARLPDARRRDGCGRRSCRRAPGTARPPPVAHRSRSRFPCRPR